MSYRLSERLDQNSTPYGDGLNLGKVASVFIIFGILSLLTAWVFSWETKKIFSDTVRPTISRSAPIYEENGEEASKDVATIGPISVVKYKEVYEISIESSLPENTWSFVEGEVLDEKKDYLFSFGKELWRESGSDSEGSWSEAENSYSMKVTFPQPGNYYLHLKTQGADSPDAIKVTISKKKGSSIPHFAFGIITLLIGIIISCMHNKETTITIIKKCGYGLLMIGFIALCIYGEM